MGILQLILSLFGGNKQSQTPTPTPAPTPAPASVPAQPVVTSTSVISVPSPTPTRAGLPIIKEFEGCKLVAYQDIVGVWTIGYGETKNVYPGMVITQAQADQMVETAYDQFQASVQQLVKVDINQNQLGALTSFTYNLGVGSLQTSTLLKLLNAGSPATVVAQQFARWNQAGGKPVDGLTRRRAAEAALFLQA
jgi:lysozyme